MGAAGNAATARALSRSTTPATTAGTWAASAQDGQGNASVAALLGQPAPAAQPVGGQPKKSGLLDKVLDPFGTAKSFMADKAWALLRRYAPELVPILQRGLGSWLQDRLANAMQWLLRVLTAPVRAITGVADSLNKQFGRLVGWMRTGLPKLVSTACKKISNGSEDVVKVVDGIEAAEDKGIAKLKDLASSAGDFLGGLWTDLGAPVAKVLGDAGSAAWQKIQQVAQWLWDKTQPIRDLGSRAWTWLKNTIGIGEGPEGRNGIIQWVQARAQSVWDWLKSKLATIPTPLKVAGGALIALSPAGPVLAAGAAAYGVVKGGRWLWDNLSDPHTLVRLRHTLVDEILPELRAGVGSVKDALKTGVNWLTSTLTEIGTGLRDLAGALTAPIVAPLSDLVTWLRQRHDEFVRWVDEHARPLADLVARALDRLRSLAGQLLTVLKKVIAVVGNPFGIGAIVMGAAWLSLPACMRSAILKFLLRLVQGALRLMPAPAVGPLGAVLREAMIGFVNRALEEQSLVQLELMANRFSRLATKGSFDFTVGYGLGLLLGLWEGISGPFRMLWDIGTLIKNAVIWVRDLTLTALTERGRALVREIKSAWNDIADEIWPAVEAFLKGPIDPGKIIKLISGITGAIAAAARNAGADAFDQMMKYLKQSDRKLGESLGKLTGSLIFEVVLIALTEGAYAAKTAVHKTVNLFTKAMTKVGELLKTLEGLLPKAKNVLDTAADIAGKKNKPAQHVTNACKKLLDKLLELLRLKYRVPDKKKPTKDPKDNTTDTDHKRDDTSDKATELPHALAEARAIVERNDRAPIRSVLRQLKKLKRRYRWIKKFRAKFAGRSGGRIHITLVGSEHPVGWLSPDPGRLRDLTFIEEVRDYLKKEKGSPPPTSGIAFNTSAVVVDIYDQIIFSSGYNNREDARLIIRGIRDRDPVLASKLKAVEHHYEVKVAAWMCKHRHTHLASIINQNYICPRPGDPNIGCQEAVPEVLESGSRLTVWHSLAVTGEPFDGVRRV
jgi:hypothetical protein